MVELADKRQPDRFSAVRTAFSRAATWVRRNRGFSAKDLKQKPVTELVRATYGALKEAVDVSIKEEVPEEMRKALLRDVFVFSGMKTYAELKEVSAMLLDDKGKIKPFGTFKQEVLKIDEQYNVQYLEAEHQFATSSGQMAAKWVQFEKDGDRYNLQFRTAGDDKVRPDHAANDRITLPPDHEYWDWGMPPLAWKCRCNVVQVLASRYPVTDSDVAMDAIEKATTQLDKKGNNKLAMFRFNPGKHKVIFPPQHPYSKVPGAKKAATGLLPKK